MDGISLAPYAKGTHRPIADGRQMMHIERPLMTSKNSFHYQSFFERHRFCKLESEPMATFIAH